MFNNEYNSNIKFNCNLWYTKDWTLEMQAWEEKNIKITPWPIPLNTLPSEGGVTV